AGDVYSALVGPLPLISRRRVILLARFDIIRLASDAVDGGEDALQQIVTVATERLRRALVHHGIPCRVLDATELAEMYLASEAAPPAGTGLVVRPGADPRRVVDAMTAVGATAVTEVLRLRRVEGRADVVDVVTTVGVTGVDDTVLPAEAGTPCHRLPTARVLPVPGETLPRPSPAHSPAAGSIRCRPWHRRHTAPGRSSARRARAPRPRSSSPGPTCARCSSRPGRRSVDRWPSARARPGTGSPWSPTCPNDGVRSPRSPMRAGTGSSTPVHPTPAHPSTR